MSYQSKPRQPRPAAAMCPAYGYNRIAVFLVSCLSPHASPGHFTGRQPALDPETYFAATAGAYAGHAIVFSVPHWHAMRVERGVKSLLLLGAVAIVCAQEGREEAFIGA